MPKLTKSVPKYREHLASGQAIVSIDGEGIYLGLHGTKTSKIESLANDLANGCTLLKPDAAPITVMRTVRSELPIYSLSPCRRMAMW